MLPERVQASLREHLKRVQRIHALDLAASYGRVALPGALNRKYPNASRDGAGNLLFPRQKGESIPRPKSRAAVASGSRSWSWQRAFVHPIDV